MITTDDWDVTIHFKWPDWNWMWVKLFYHTNEDFITETIKDLCPWTSWELYADKLLLHQDHLKIFSHWDTCFSHCWLP